MTYMWIDRLSDEDALGEVVAEMNFARRVGVIRLLLRHRSLPHEFVARATAAWSQACGLGDTRNFVAHSPVIFGWDNSDGYDERPPDFIGTFSLKRARGEPPRAETVLQMERLKEAVNDCADLGQELDSLYSQLVNLRPEP